MRMRPAFTLTEVIVGIMIMAITYMAMSLSPSTADQSSEHEAEKLAAYIYSIIQRADRLHTNFEMDMCFNSSGKYHYVEIKWDGVEWPNNIDASFRASAGCKYTDNFNGTEGGELVYNSKKRRFNTGGTITITDSEGKSYYVIIASTEGRIRISKTPPD